VSNVLRSGVMTDPRERRGNGIEPAAVTTQHNPTYASEPRGDATSANNDSQTPGAANVGAGVSSFVTPHRRLGEVSLGAGALSLDTMDEYAAELAEVGRMLRDGAFRAGAVVNGQADTGAISSTIVSIPLASCRSHNEKNRRVSHD
jgi:hypothetical protein